MSDRAAIGSWRVEKMVRVEKRFILKGDVQSDYADQKNLSST